MQTNFSSPIVPISRLSYCFCRVKNMCNAMCVRNCCFCDSGSMRTKLSHLQQLPVLGLKLINLTTTFDMIVLSPFILICSTSMLLLAFFFFQCLTVHGGQTLAGKVGRQCCELIIFKFLCLVVLFITMISTSSLINVLGK